MRKWLKRLGLGVGSLVAVVILSAGVIYAASEMRLRKEYQLVAKPLTVAQDPALVERGRHVAAAIGKCGDCHGLDLGGKIFIDAGPVGKLYASNLTAGKGGVLGEYTDAQLELAIRHGVGADGRGLLGMPSNEFYYFSDGDLAAVIAYLRTVPAVDRELPASTVGPVGRGLMVAGKLPLLSAEDIDHAAPRPAAPAPGVTVEYGEYLARTGGCTGCHQADLAGGHIAGTPPEFPSASNLTPAAIGHWTEADFFRALREGKRPGGGDIDPFMPWQSAGKMTDDEIRALWTYLKSVPPAATRTP